MTASDVDLDNLVLTDEPEQQNAVFVAAFNSGRGALFDRLYLDDAVSNLTGTPRTGADRRAAITEFLATGPVLEANTTYTMTARDTILFGVEFWLRTTGDDGAPVRVHGLCTDVLVRKPDGYWAMAVDRPVVLDTVRL